MNDDKKFLSLGAVIIGGLVAWRISVMSGVTIFVILTVVVLVLATRRGG